MLRSIEDQDLFTLNSLPAAKVSTTMERETNAECADMHLAYGATNGNSREAVRIYVARYPNRHVPAHQAFVSIHRRLCEDGAFRRTRAEGRRRRR